MYRPKSIEWWGFGRYIEKQSLTFRPGLTFITGKNFDSEKSDSNGTGKTTVLFTIPWVLWGKCPDGIGLRDAIGHEVRDCGVKLVLEGSDADLYIQRKASPRAHTLEVEVASRVNPRFLAGDIRAIQQELDELIGCSFNLFCSCLYLAESSDAKQFLFAKPQERSAILSYLVEDGSFQTGAEIAKGKAAQAGIMAQQCARDQQSLEQQLWQAQRDLEQLMLHQQHHQALESTRIQEANSRIRVLRDQIIGWGQELTLANQALQSGGMEELGRQHRSLLTGLSEKERQVMKLEVSIAQLADIQSPQCPTCAQPIGPEWRESRAEQRQGLEQERRHLELQVQQDRSTLQGLSNQMEAVRTALGKREGIVAALQNGQVQYRHLEDDLQPRPLPVIDDQIAQIQTRIRQIQTAALAKATETDKYVVRQSGMLQVEKSFKTQVRDLLYDEIRGKLEGWTQHYLAELIDTNIRVQYPTDSVKDKFEITVWNDGYGQELSSYSGGEKWRISFALMLALRMVLSEAGGCELYFLLVDDPIGKLDRTGTREFAHLLSKVAGTSIPYVLVTVPKEEALEVQAHVLEVTRKNGRSTCRYI